MRIYFVETLDQKLRGMSVGGDLNFAGPGSCLLVERAPGRSQFVVVEASPVLDGCAVAYH